VRTSSVTTDCPEVAGQLIGRIFAQTRLHLDRADDDFQFRVVSADAGDLSCGIQRWGFTGRSESEPLSSFTTVLVTAGSMCQMRPGQPDAVLGPGGVWHSSTDRLTRATWAPDSTFATLHLPLPSIAEAASARSDAPGADVRFLDNTPVDEAAGRYWAQLMRMAYHEATATASSLESPLVRSHLVRMLADAALTVFPNSVVTAYYQRSGSPVGPRTLQQAVAYMHARAAQPLTIAEIAQVAGVSPRTLQVSFLRHHDCTPITYLRRIRLERVHQDLQAAEPGSGETVTGIARRWGFAHPGRFAAAYAERYGTHPSTTLRA
jgi:AraC-like DNA-binding protein